MTSASASLYVSFRSGATLRARRSTSCTGLFRLRSAVDFRNELIELRWAYADVAGRLVTPEPPARTPHGADVLHPRGFLGAEFIGNEGNSGSLQDPRSN